MKKNFGFTLIELVVVIAVLITVSTIFLSVINPRLQIEKSYDARRKADLAEIQRSLEQYYQDKGKYPANPGDCTDPTREYRIVDPQDSNSFIEWGMPWQPYMNALPRDPGSKTYVYVATCQGQVYYLYASLDIGNDPKLCKGGDKCDNAPDSACGGGICNYGVSSPNVSP